MVVLDRAVEQLGDNEVLDILGTPSVTTSSKVIAIELMAKPFRSSSESRLHSCR